jgi:hypothetical protein
MSKVELNKDLKAHFDTILKLLFKKIDSLVEKEGTCKDCLDDLIQLFGFCRYLLEGG